MIRRLFVTCGACAALAGAACLDMSAPKGGVASLSRLMAPARSVVIGDVLRDSTGAPAPLRVVAYDQAGTPIPDAPISFVLLDRGAHIDSAGLFFGDSLALVRVVAVVAGVQTSPDTVIVTSSPDTAISTADIDTLTLNLADTTKNKSNALSLKLQDHAGAPAQGFIVHYQVVFAPPGTSDTDTTAYVTDGSKLSLADTTDATGTASRFAAVRVAALAGPPDSVVVEASVMYKGLAVPGSPLRFVVPVRLPTAP